jgi:hypothetical protein
LLRALRLSGSALYASMKELPSAHLEQGEPPVQEAREVRDGPRQLHRHRVDEGIQIRVVGAGVSERGRQRAEGDLPGRVRAQVAA